MQGLVTLYHRNIQKSIIAVGRMNPERYDKVYSDKRPIHINHPMMNKAIEYFPDATYELKNGTKHVFEVMDSETDRQALVLAHVVEAALARQVRKVFFIVSTEKEQDTVEHITSIILANLEDLSDRRIGRGVKFYFMIVPRKDARSYQKTRHIIEGQLSATQNWPRAPRRKRNS